MDVHGRSGTFGLHPLGVAERHASSHWVILLVQATLKVLAGTDSKGPGVRGIVKATKASLSVMVPQEVCSCEDSLTAVGLCMVRVQWQKQADLLS